MGRKAQPVDVILLKGKKHLTKEEIEERRQAEERVRPRDDKVRCPKWLDKVGRAEWRRICAELKALNLLTNVDVSSLAIYCDQVSQYVKATKDIQERGMILRSKITDDEGEEKLESGPASPRMSKAITDLMYPGEDPEEADRRGERKKGKITITIEEPNPSVAQAAKCAQLIKMYLIEFGLSPSARVKLRPPKPGEGQANPFEQRFGNVV